MTTFPGRHPSRSTSATSLASQSILSIVQRCQQGFTITSHHYKLIYQQLHSVNDRATISKLKIQDLLVPILTIMIMITCSKLEVEGCHLAAVPLPHILSPLHPLPPPPPKPGHRRLLVHQKTRLARTSLHWTSTSPTWQRSNLA